MAFSDSSRREAFLPSFLYSPALKSSGLERILSRSTSPPMAQTAPSSRSPSPSPSSFLVEAPNEPTRKIEMYTPAFYAACTAGGILSCGLTHMTVTPLDLVKCNMQVSESASPFIAMIFQP